MAFSGCVGLKSVTIPSGVTSIGSHAFSECDSLTSIEIPEGVTSIGSFAFYSCGGLTSVKIPESVTQIGGFVFCHCGGLTSVEIPESVTSIGESAFSDCKNLKLLITSGSVAENYAIKNGLTYEIIKQASPETMAKLEQMAEREQLPDGYVWASEDDLKVETLEDGTLSITGYTGRDMYIAIPEEIGGKKVTEIGTRAFCGDRVIGIVIPEGVTSIGEAAFQYCSILRDVEIAEGVTSIGDSAFHLCINLTSMEFPESLTSISEFAFYACTNLTSVEIPESVTSIGKYAFSQCENLTLVVSSGSVSETYAIEYKIPYVYP